MTHLVTIGVLEAKQQELVKLMTDQNSTNIQKLSYTMMYNDIAESIEVLNREFFKIEKYNEEVKKIEMLTGRNYDTSVYRQPSRMEGE